MFRTRANLFAFAGGTIQLVLAFMLLFLPVFATCYPQGQETVCYRQSYIQQGGNILGFTFLALMIVAGLLGIASTRLTDYALARRFRWIGVILTVSFAVIGAWSIGLPFVPGGILLLLSALLSRQSTNVSTQDM